MDIRTKGKGKPRRVTGALREETTEMRLNKFLALAGVAARRKADELIESGVVRVNGKIITTLGVRVNPTKDEVSVQGTPVHIENRLVYILLNKPKDCITTTSDEKDRATVLELVPEFPRVYPVGRLDRNTTGVLLLTNDGDLAYKLMHPKFSVPRVYVAFLKSKIRNADVVRLQEGVDIGEGEMTSPCQVDILNIPENTTVGLVLREGKNHEVRRMFEAIDNEVLKLERVEYAGFTTAGLKRGGWRYLAENEVEKLKKSLASEEPAKKKKRKK
jgi:pseudouridine synthase